MFVAHSPSATHVVGAATAGCSCTARTVHGTPSGETDILRVVAEYIATLFVAHLNGTVTATQRMAAASVNPLA